MYPSPAFVLVALAFLFAAAPSEEVPRDGIPIPIAKRSGFRNRDGVVDVTRIQAGLRRTVMKIQRGLEAFERNTGSAHPSASKLKHLTKRGHGDPLTNDSAELWYGPITVGTPPVTYAVDFDTGSADLFLPASDCGKSCFGHKRYDPSASSTSVDMWRIFKFLYGDGSAVSGDQYADTVTLAGYVATGQVFGAAKVYSTGFRSDKFPADGVLGMGYESISVERTTPVFQSLVSQGQVSVPMFSFYLAKLDSELYIGGVNQNLYKGLFTYMPVTTPGYWEGSLDGISVNGETIVLGGGAIIDTGTTQVVGNPLLVQAIYNCIPGSEYIGNGTWTIPCHFKASVSMAFSGTEFQISAATFNLGPISPGSRSCIGGFGAVDHLALWVVGDVFLQNVYTSFDFGKNRVGFASLA